MQVMIASPRATEMNKQNIADKALSAVPSCPTVSTVHFRLLLSILEFMPLNINDFIFNGGIIFMK